MVQDKGPKLIFLYMHETTKHTRVYSSFSNSRAFNGLTNLAYVKKKYMEHLSQKSVMQRWQPKLDYT